MRDKIRMNSEYEIDKSDSACKRQSFYITKKSNCEKRNREKCYIYKPNIEQMHTKRANTDVYENHKNCKKKCNGRDFDLQNRTAISTKYTQKHLHTHIGLIK